MFEIHNPAKVRSAALIERHLFLPLSKNVSFEIF